MDQVKIGGFLRELRKEKNQSQEQIAERFGVSSRSVSRWENGNTMPDISIMINKVFLYGVASTAAFVILLVMYIFNLYSKSGFMNDLFVIMFYIGGVFSISTILAGLQLQGRMSKQRLKKITKIALPVCVILMIMLSVLIYLLMSV